METYTTFYVYNIIIQENNIGSEQVIKPEAAKTRSERFTNCAIFAQQNVIDNFWFINTMSIINKSFTVTLRTVSNQNWYKEIYCVSWGRILDEKNEQIQHMNDICL